MRTRRLLLSAAGGASGLLAAAVALAQDPAPPVGTGDAKYYQGKVSPPPAGLFPQRAVTAPGGRQQPATYPPVVGIGQTAPAGVIPVGPPGAQPPANKPKFTQPVIAGPDGVQQVGGNAPAVPAFPPASAGPLAAPVVGIEQPGLPKLPDPKPLAPDLPPPVVSVAPGKPNFDPPTVTAEPGQTVPPPVVTAPPSVPRSMPRPAFQEPPVGPAPTGGTPRATPSVVVEMNAPGEVGVNQPLTYELVIRNVGTGAVGNLRLEDELPARCQFVASDPPAEAGTDRLGWLLGNLDAGAERRVRVTVKAGEEGEIRSRASVSYTSAVETRVKVTRPRVTVAVTGPENVRVGDRVPFQIKLTNVGTGTASVVKLQAKFSDGLSHPSGQVIEADLPGLKAGETRTLNLDGVTGLKAGAHALTLIASADAAPAEQAKATLTLVEPLLTIKQAGPARCLVRGEPTFTVELTNPGTAATDPVQVWAALPAGFEFVAASDGGAVLDTKQVGWRLGGLPPGGTKTLSLKVRATSPADGVLRTVASCAPITDATAAGLVQVDGRTPPVGRGLEARAESTVKAEGVPALRFEVAGQEGTVEVGKEAVYEVRVMNLGTGPCTNVQLTAELAEGTALAGATGHTAARSDRLQVTFDPIPSFGVKGEAVYKVRVKGVAAGDHRFRVRLVCDQVRTPLVKEENTRFYKE